MKSIYVYIEVSMSKQTMKDVSHKRGESTQNVFERGDTTHKSNEESE